MYTYRVVDFNVITNGRASAGAARVARARMYTCVFSLSHSLSISLSLSFTPDLAARYTAYIILHAFYYAEELARPASADDGIRLINIDVDSGSYSCRDEKLAKFRVTKEGKERGNGVPTELRMRFLGVNYEARLRNGTGDTPTSCASKAPKMAENLDIPFYKSSNIRGRFAERNFPSRKSSSFLLSSQLFRRFAKRFDYETFFLIYR